MAYSITQAHGEAGTSSRSSSPTFIVVHYTGGGSRESGAKGNRDYFAGGSEGRYVAAHYILDESIIYEYADPKTKECVHCGGGQGWNSRTGIFNSNSIGIEVCVPDEGPYSDKEIDRLTWLVQKLMREFNISADHVVRHYDASGKACPWYYTPSGAGGNAAWEQLHKQITGGTVLFSGSASDSSSTMSSGIMGTISISDPAIAYAAGIEGQILFDQEDIYPYVITIDEKTEDLDIEKLKKLDVIGVCIDMGSYFTESHTINKSFRSTKLEKQYNECKKEKLTVGLMTTLRAKNKEEALEELYEIRLTVLKYPPDMGLWLKPTFYSKNKKQNDELIKIYYDALIKLGFYDQVGFYCKKEDLEKFNWEKVCEDWYWWMDRHIEKLDKIHSLPTPKFFMYDDPGDEDALIDPDFSGWEALKATGGSFMMSGGTSGGGYTDYQELIAKIAETSNNVCLISGLCARFVREVYDEARKQKPDIPAFALPAAIDYWNTWKNTGGTDTNPPVGSAVIGSGSSDLGALYGHIGIVLTDGRVAENVGGRRIVKDVQTWGSGMHATCQGHTGYIGWVWPGGVDLSKKGTMVGGGGNFTKFTNLSQDELSELAYWAIKEQGESKAGIAAECSLMANRYENEQSRYRNAHDYVLNSRWFGPANRGSRGHASAEATQIAYKVFCEGKRTLPRCIDEHDWRNDISHISTGNKNNDSDYIKNQTIIYNNMGATYTFWSFPVPGGDPFGYTANRKQQYPSEACYPVESL